MLGLTTKSRSNAEQRAIVGVASTMIEKVAEVWRERLKKAEAERDQALQRVKALERRLDGWVPADQASSMRWRIRELEEQLREADLDRKTVALFSPGLPLGFKPAAEPFERVAD